MELVHQTFTFNRSGTMFDVNERLVPVLCAPLLAVHTTPADMEGCPVEGEHCLNLPNVELGEG